MSVRTSLVVQWLGLHASHAGGEGSISGGRTNIRELSGEKDRWGPEQRSLKNHSPFSNPSLGNPPLLGLADWLLIRKFTCDLKTVTSALWI